MIFRTAYTLISENPRPLTCKHDKAGYFLKPAVNSNKETKIERFDHGFVLGFMVDLADGYTMTSNRESGFGRYDVMLESVKATGINTNSVILCMVNMMKKLIFKGETKDGRIRKQ